MGIRLRQKRNKSKGGDLLLGVRRVTPRVGDRPNQKFWEDLNPRTLRREMPGTKGPSVPKIATALQVRVLRGRVVLRLDPLESLGVGLLGDPLVAVTVLILEGFLGDAGVASPDRFAGCLMHTHYQVT